MSMLLGPLSETISSVSWPDCALAGDQIAGADTALPAATAVIDLRKSRRFIASLPNAGGCVRECPQRSCQNRGAVPARIKQLIERGDSCDAAGQRGRMR